MQQSKALQNDIKNFVSKLFAAGDNNRLIYHNLQHTTQVVAHCMEIGDPYQLSGNDHLILYTAAWFHDTGHLMEPAAGHEIRSAGLMRHFCRNAGMNELSISRAEQCILSTQLPQHPKCLLEEILCDADLYHLGTKDFFVANELVKKETEIRELFLSKEWNQKTLSFLENHHYFTDYCKELLNQGKQQNLNVLKNKMATHIK